MKLRAERMSEAGAWVKVTIWVICAGVDMAEPQVVYTLDSDQKAVLRAEPLYTADHAPRFRLT